MLQTLPGRYGAYWAEGMRAKLGLAGEAEGDAALIDELLALLRAQGVDYTLAFRGLAATLDGEPGGTRSLFADPSGFDAWVERWRARVGDPAAAAEGMRRVNPVYVARNHLVEEALAAATDGDLRPFRRLLEVLARPFDERPGLEAFAAPPPESFGASYRTFCGT